MPLPLQRAITAVVATLIMVPWVWRRVWSATEMLDWEQADLEQDVVPEDVWNAIVTTIHGIDAEEWSDDDE